MSFAGLMRGDRDFLKNPVNFRDSYVRGLKNAFDKRKDTSSEIESDEIYATENKAFNDKFKKDNTKGFLDSAISGGLDYFKKSQEKSDTDKLIDFAKSQQGKVQFGDNTSGLSTEVADGLSIFQPPSPNQMMFIPGKEGTGKSFTQRLAGGAAGLLKGLSTGIPHAGGIGAVAGFFG